MSRTIGSFVSSRFARQLIGAVLFGALAASAASAATGILTGFVTQVDSPTQFYVGAVHVLLDGKTQCDAQNLRSEIQLKTTGFFLTPRSHYRLQNRLVSTSELAVPCNELSLRVGSRVQVTGDREPHGGSFSAAQLTVYKVDIQRKFHTSWKPAKWSGGALLEEKPQVSRTAQGWTGSLWLDGYPMRIAPDTKPLTAPDLKKMTIGSFFRWALPVDDAILPSEAAVSGYPASLFQPNTWAAYRGARRANGPVILDRIGLWPNRPYFGCKIISADLTPTIHLPNYATHASGSALFHRSAQWHSSETLSILSDRNVQEYVSRLGAALVPRYQKDMPEKSDTRIDFRFYVVQSAGSTFDDLVTYIDSLPYYMSRSNWDDAVLALPSGAIFVPTSTLRGVKSEAQLAAILSSAIASVLQQHICIASYESSGWGGVTFGENTTEAIARATSYKAFVFGFVLWRDEQALRIGIRQMYLAGYDIGEAPVAWAAAIGKPFTNPLTDPAQSATGVPWYTAYAFHYISQFYSDVDYSRLKRGRAEYAQFLKELRKADPDAFVHEK